ncbi:uncharacterized protein LOC143029459 [Oratosquilla oratoria]|uniref:uncharacterized protein LOC143029459 n=1 Tax=Oratosquilla oratoria TaxID=337810 RepID=UPI003F7710A4
MNGLEISDKNLEGVRTSSLPECYVPSGLSTCSLPSTSTSSTTTPVCSTHHPTHDTRLNFYGRGRWRFKAPYLHRWSLGTSKEGVSAEVETRALVEKMPSEGERPLSDSLPVFRKGSGEVATVIIRNGSREGSEPIPCCRTKVDAMVQTQPEMEKEEEEEEEDREGEEEEDPAVHNGEEYLLLVHELGGGIVGQISPKGKILMTTPKKSNGGIKPQVPMDSSSSSSAPPPPPPSPPSASQPPAEDHEARSRPVSPKGRRRIRSKSLSDIEELSRSGAEMEIVDLKKKVDKETDVQCDGQQIRTGCRNDKASYGGRNVRTLAQHYYPEGGWGWVIIFMSVLVHILNHGLHTAGGILFLDIVSTFSQSAVNAGK